MGQWYRRDAVDVEALADGVRQAPDAEQPPGRKAADGDDQGRLKQAELLVRARRRRAPARAVSECGRRALPASALDSSA